MLKALERSAASASERIVFLAPSPAAAFDASGDVRIEPELHARLVGEVQRFRGSVYLKDGAIRTEHLTRDGRHCTPEDEHIGHVVLLDDAGAVTGCVLYLEHGSGVRLEDLRARNCPLAHDPEWAGVFADAVTGELNRARQEGLRYVEVGGWAVSEKGRRTAGPLALALAAYAFANRGAAALAMTTATFRHCSANILKRLGGHRFDANGTVLPPYFDPRYQCLMELLRFDSRTPNPLYASLVDRITATLSRVRVIARPAAVISQAA